MIENDTRNLKLVLIAMLTINLSKTHPPKEKILPRLDRESSVYKQISISHFIKALDPVFPQDIFPKATGS